MAKNHLFRIAAPLAWSLKRKAETFIARPIPGPHQLDKSLTINFILRNILGYAKTTKEIKLLLTNKEIHIDKVARTDYRFPVGLMDVLEIPKLKEHYRMIFDTKGYLKLITIDNSEANVKPLKVVKKTVIKKGKIQITFHDGRNTVQEKTEVKIGDVALFDLEKNQVKKWLKIGENTIGYLTGGSHIGNIAKIKKIISVKNLEKPKALIEIEGKEYITPISYVFVIGKDKPEVKLD